MTPDPAHSERRLAILEVLDPSGHLVLTWNPNEPASVEQARAEFERLKGCGFGFFIGEAEDAPKVTRLKGAALQRSGELVIRSTRTFDPEAERTVAVRPMRGG